MVTWLARMNIIIIFYFFGLATTLAVFDFFLDDRCGGMQIVPCKGSENGFSS